MILELNNITKTYKTRFGKVSSQALKGISFTVEEGEYVAIMGESGSGKTTLLNIISTLDNPTSGTILLEGKPMENIKASDMARFRRENLGFVFQDFNLLDTFNVKDNILLPLVLSNIHIKEMEKRVHPILKMLNIEKLSENYPYEISGGEKQRVAIARAIITKPKLLLADEPTGALDSRASKTVLNSFREINNNGQTILMVTHSIAAASHADRILFIKDGVIYNQIFRGSRDNDELYNLISDTLSVMTTGGSVDETI